jgi:8-oxo-dGTP pyrophosphatase MutT (NUDIX family)
MTSKKRRGTVIYENPQGILLTRTGHHPWLLPGGHAERNEPRIITAIRELAEETTLRATEVKYLFDFESTYFFHKVYLIRAEGNPIPASEITALTWYQPENIELIKSINKSSLEIINLYMSNRP